MNQTAVPFPPPATPERPRNPFTHARHRREVLRQVTLPLVIGCVVILALSILVVWESSGGETGRWASISLIWLIAPTLLFALIALLLLGGLIYLVTIMFIRLPAFARKIQDFFLLVHYQVAQLDDKIVEPILRVHSTKASASSLKSRLRPKR